MCGGELGINDKYLVVGDYQSARELLEGTEIQEGCQIFYGVSNEDFSEGVIRLKGLESFINNTLSQLKKLNGTEVYRLIKS